MSYCGCSTGGVGSTDGSRGMFFMLRVGLDIIKPKIKKPNRNS